MANINKIRLSGQTYNIQDENASKTVELTQAQYDALTVKDPNTFYIITDAQGADLSQYYTSAQTESAITQAVSGKVDTSTFNTYSGSVETALNAKADTATTYTKTEVDNAITAATSTKQDTLVSGTNIKTINNESILGSGNITIEGGGGKAIEAGRGISITTGETADTVSFNLPISAGTSTNSIIIGFSGNTATGYHSVAVGANSHALKNGAFAEGASTASGYYSHSEGSRTQASGDYSHAEGNSTTASGSYSHAEGYNTIVSGNSSHAEGSGTTASGDYSHAEGQASQSNGRYSHAEGYNTRANGQYSHAEGTESYASGSYSHAEGLWTIANNSGEHASGRYNNSVSGSSTFGDSGNTLFSVGNGTSTSARHNAFEIRQNGDIYLSYNGSDIKLQDLIADIYSKLPTS